MRLRSHTIDLVKQATLSSGGMRKLLLGMIRNVAPDALPTAGGVKGLRASLSDVESLLQGTYGLKTLPRRGPLLEVIGRPPPVADVRAGYKRFGAIPQADVPAVRVAREGEGFSLYAPGRVGPKAEKIRFLVDPNTQTLMRILPGETDPKVLEDLLVRFSKSKRPAESILEAMERPARRAAAYREGMRHPEAQQLVAELKRQHGLHLAGDPGGKGFPGILQHEGSYAPGVHVPEDLFEVGGALGKPSHSYLSGGTKGLSGGRAGLVEEYRDVDPSIRGFMGVTGAKSLTPAQLAAVYGVEGPTFHAGRSLMIDMPPQPTASWMAHWDPQRKILRSLFPGKSIPLRDVATGDLPVRFEKVEALSIPFKVMLEALAWPMIKS